MHITLFGIFSSLLVFLLLFKYFSRYSFHFFPLSFRNVYFVLKIRKTESEQRGKTWKNERPEWVDGGGRYTGGTEAKIFTFWSNTSFYFVVIEHVIGSSRRNSLKYSEIFGRAFFLSFPLLSQSAAMKKKLYLLRRPLPDAAVGKEEKIKKTSMFQRPWMYSSNWCRNER